MQVSNTLFETIVDVSTPILEQALSFISGGLVVVFMVITGALLVRAGIRTDKKY